MNSPPEALSPSPSTPSSGSPSPDEIGLPTPLASTPSGSGTIHPLQANVLASPGNQAQAKRRLPPSSSSTFSGREGRENKSRRRERDRDSDRDVREDRTRKGGGAWESVRGEMQGHAHGGHPPRLREELVDVAMVEYVRTTYGDPFDDTVLKERNNS